MTAALAQTADFAFCQAPPHSPNGQSAASAQEHTALLSDDSSTWQSAASLGAKRPLSPQQLLSMTVLLAGIQFVWTVELGYGTPYLLSLGLSKPLMTLVWMAGPLSGLLIQPVVGSLSDRCFSKLGRRRPFIAGGAAFVVASVIAIAYAKEMSQFLARLKGLSGSTEPGSDYHLFVTRTSIVVAVIGFYVLDFSINTSQACARALALDIPPLHQQDLANAYAGRMLNLGSVSGYMVGFMDLRALLPWKTDSQMQALCLVATVVFVATITWTCVSVREVPLVAKEEEDSERLEEEDQPGSALQRPRQRGGLMREWSAMFTSIAQGIVRLPTPVQRICNVQFFAWVAWFPFLFFATTWVTEVMARTAVDARDPDFVERATRAGSFALFLYSIASLAFSMVLPLLVKDEALPSSSPAKVSLRMMWRLSLVAMCATLLLTRFVADVRGATALIVAMAFPWSLAMWAPFALVGEYVSIAADGADDSRQEAADDVGAAADDVEEAEEGEDGMAGSGARAGAQMIPAASYGACDDNDNDSDSEMLLGRSVCGSQLADELVVGSQSTATPLWRRQHGLAEVHRSGAVVRGDSIASTVGGDDLQLPPNSKTHCPNKRPSRIGEEGGGQLAGQPEAAQRQMRRAEKLESGAILGIHNMYVVLPQFVINAVSSLVFAWLGGSSDAGKGALRSVEFMAMDAAYSVLGGPAAGEAVGTVLRIGGASALVAAALTLLLFDRRRVREYVCSQQL
ncbi:hypothetical protein GGI23_000362 [Coemansia sp. RSA 2559]|nr:hypothetical protein GGI23_000362 [Coemansia sp. RSA 2559]KAJ2869027.1 hypothetical protein GGI22_000509 [Coemansia erecta]